MRISTYAFDYLYVYTTRIFYLLDSVPPNCIEMMACMPTIVAFTSFIFDKLCTCLRLSTHQIIPDIFVSLSLSIQIESIEWMQTQLHVWQVISVRCLI